MTADSSSVGDADGEEYFGRGDHGYTSSPVACEVASLIELKDFLTERALMPDAINYLAYNITK